MTAVVSREQARTTCLTGAAGVLMLVVAVVMMMVAAPAHGPARAVGPAPPSVVRLTTDVCHQLTSRSYSATVRACLAGPSADSAWTDAYVPSIIGSR
jgi:hypothetical protein